LLSSGGPGWIDDGSSYAEILHGSQFGCDYMVSFQVRNTYGRSWISHDGHGSDLGNDGNKKLRLELCEIMNDPKCISLVSIKSDLECGLKCIVIVSDVR